MTDPSFVDTNVLVYAIDGRDPRKRAIARDLIARLLTQRSMVLSTQVLLEFFHAATRKVRYPERDALAAIDTFLQADVVETSKDLVIAAAELSILEQLSVWDSMIIAAAAQRHCRALYSEDLAARRRIRGARIENPFAP